MFQNQLRFNSHFLNLKEKFGVRVQKVPVNAGFTCPNRDGSKGNGGCIFCDNDAFSPFYSSSKKTVKQQIDEGIEYFSKKYKAEKFVVYFQAYSNTYASLEHLKTVYSELDNYKNIVGIFIATRPDCVDAQKLDYFAELNKKILVSIEYGIESTNNETLEIINRKHTFEETQTAILETAKRNILNSAHLILGLPGETEKDFIDHAHKISGLPINSLKLHHLQIIKNTYLEKLYLQKADNIKLFTSEEYFNLVIRFLEHLNPQIAIERFVNEVPDKYLIAPRWERFKNYQIAHIIDNKMKETDTYQGKYYKP